MHVPRGTAALVLAGLAACAAGPAAAGDTPGGPDALVARAVSWLGRARATGDPAWIERAGAALEAAHAADPSHYGVRRATAWLALSRHDFRAARDAASAALAVEPHDAWNLALLADACLELGDYACAERTVDRLASLRPGAVAWTRVAALRALLGDRRGAVAALDAALATTAPTDDGERAWLLVHLGLEHEALGDVAAAAACQEAALALAPGHHLALPALARVRMAQGRLDEAASLLEEAAERLPSLAVFAMLGDVQALRGRHVDARRAWDAALAAEGLAAAQGRSHGRDAALFLADHGGDLDEALRLVRADAAARDDVHTADALAWVLHRRGDHRNAMRAAHRALRLSTEEAGFHCHAAAIADALVRPRVAARRRRTCLALDPTFDVRQGAIARAALAGQPPEQMARAEGTGRP